VETLLTFRTFEALEAFERFTMVPAAAAATAPSPAPEGVQEREIATKGLNFVWEAFKAKLFPKFEIKTLTDVRDWKALFGCSPLICDTIWGSLEKQELIPQKTEPVHLLWALHFLKTYGTEAVCGSFVGKMAKTYRDHVWPVVEAVAALRVVSRVEFAFVAVGWLLLTISFPHTRLTLQNGSVSGTEAVATSLSTARTFPSKSRGRSTLSGSLTS
jgi:hypothetical protein